MKTLRCGTCGRFVSRRDEHVREYLFWGFAPECEACADRRADLAACGPRRDDD